MEKKKKNKKISVTTISTIVMLFSVFGIVALLAYIESITLPWAIEIWALIFVLLTSVFSFCFMLCHNVREKKKDETPV